MRGVISVSYSFIHFHSYHSFNSDFILLPSCETRNVYMLIKFTINVRYIKMRCVTFIAYLQRHRKVPSYINVCRKNVNLTFYLNYLLSVFTVWKKKYFKILCLLRKVFHNVRMMHGVFVIKKIPLFLNISFEDIILLKSTNFEA